MTSGKLSLTLVLVIAMLGVSLWLEHQRAETYVRMNQELVATLNKTTASLKAREATYQQQTEALEKLTTAGATAIKTMKEADSTMAYQTSVILKQRKVIDMCMVKFGTAGTVHWDTPVQ